MSYGKEIYTLHASVSRRLVVYWCMQGRRQDDPSNVLSTRIITRPVNRTWLGTQVASPGAYSHDNHEVGCFSSGATWRNLWPPFTSQTTAGLSASWIFGPGLPVIKPESAASSFRGGPGSRQPRLSNPVLILRMSHTDIASELPSLCWLLSVVSSIFDHTCEWGGVVPHVFPRLRVR